VGKLKALSNTFNSLTGISGRHNRALHDTNEFLAKIQDFYSNYNLPEESPDFKSLLEKIGYAKLDLTNLAHHLRPIVKTVKDIKGVQSSQIMEEVLSRLEEFRRALTDPDLRKAQLEEVISELHESVTNLQQKLSELEYK
jgi:hypothetical protein